MASRVDKSTAAARRLDAARYPVSRILTLCCAVLMASTVIGQLTPVTLAQSRAGGETAGLDDMSVAHTDQSGASVRPLDPRRAAETGRFFVQNFSPREYGEHNANWAVTQDASGLLYVANTNGVLVFDGATWELIPAPNRSTVRSLAVDSNNRVYVGARSEIGYLGPDSTGVLRFVSLLEHLAEADRDFSDVWQTFATPDGIYFMAPQQLMRWSQAGGFQVWPASTSFHVSFLVRDTLYVRQRGVGMLRMTDAGLRLVPGGEALSDEEVFVLLPHGESGLLAVTRTMGVLLHDGTSFQPFQTAAADFLADNQVYHGSVLPGGSYALGTLRGGVVIIDESGAILHVLDQSTGLREQKTWFTFVDREGGLWLALDDGLARVEISSPISYFDDESGLEGWIGDIVRHDGDLYVATGLGVYRLQPADGTGEPSSFRLVPGIDVSCWSLLSTEAGLLASCQDRTYVYRNGAVRVVHAEGTGFSLLRARDRPEWIYEGMSDGLVVLRLESDRWVADGRVAGVSEQIFTLAEDADGALWLGTGHEGMMRLDFGGQMATSPRVERFDGRHGLPEGWTNAFSFEGGILVGTQSGTLRFDDPDQRFVPDTTLTAPFTDEPREVFLLHESASGGVLLYSDPDIVTLRRAADNSYRVDETALRRLPDAQVYRFFTEQDGILWVGRSDGLYRLDDSRLPLAPEPAAVMRSVALLEGDSLLVGRNPPDVRRAPLPAALNSLRFTYGFPHFDDVHGTRYQSRLDGFDREWSEWTAASQRDYTNLPHGDYVFRVRAQDVFGTVSREAAVAMSILPPWYRTWWAYLFYGVLGIALLAAAVGWRSRRLIQQKRSLESTVRERTAEIEEQRRLLEVQAEALLEHDELKSRLFENISHEFRTPLTLTIGPLDDLKSGLYGELDPDVEEQVDLALRNSRRLLRLINQLLDAAKIESGRLMLDLEVRELGAYLRNVAEAFAPLAERRRIHLSIDVPESEIYARFDTDQLEKVFANLLSNAFKFTPPDGRMRVSLRTVAEADSSWARISVEDSGPGIPAEEVEHVFERFYQVDGTRRGAGTGIGLSLAKELVELHGGRIDVESREGIGTLFTVDLPIVPEDLAEGSEPVVSRQDAQTSAPPKGSEVDGEMSDVRATETPIGDAAAHSIGGDGERGEATGGAAPAGAEGTGDEEDVTTVLIVDDNREVRAYLRRHLERAYRVAEASDGAEALEAARELIPDVVISDVVMPEMDGFALCEAIKGDPELDFIPVILLTARAAAEDKIEGWKEGADAYLTKPFEMPELEARVANLIASRQRLRERLRNRAAVRSTQEEVVSADEAYLNRVRTAVERNLSNSAYSVAALASDVGQSRVQLYRRLQTLLGKSPSDLIREIRLEHAATLLAGRAGTVGEIAYGVGFKSVSHFCKCFRDQFGASPTEFLSEHAAHSPKDD